MLFGNNLVQFKGLASPATQYTIYPSIHVLAHPFHSLANQWLNFLQGAGLLGIFTCALLKEAGFGKVYCYDIISERLEMAKKFGAIPINGGNVQCSKS